MIHHTSTSISSLDALPVGSSGTVADLPDASGSLAHRLRELGFTRGAAVECVGKSPLGGMRAYKVSGAVIALRDEDAATIILAP